MDAQPMQGRTVCRPPRTGDSRSRSPHAIFVVSHVSSPSRRSMSRLRLLLPLVLVGGCVSAGAVATPRVGELPRSHAPMPTESAITPADLMTRLYIIADDSMLGRESGTIGNVKVPNYLGREMERMGLQPAGENGTYFQTVPVTLSRIDSTRPLTVDGTALALGSDMLPFYAGSGGRALPLGASTRSLDGVSVVYGGQLGGTVIDPGAAAGKLVVFTVPAGANGRRDWRFYTQGSLPQFRDAAGIAAAGLGGVPPATVRRLRGGPTPVPDGKPP